MAIKQQHQQMPHYSAMKSSLPFRLAPFEAYKAFTPLQIGEISDLVVLEGPI